jgi:hypothetical protein
MKTLMHRAPATDYFILPAIVLPDPLYYRKVAHLRVEQSCCPSRYSLENYKHTRNNMGYSAFNIQYQHEPFLQAVKHG